MSPEVVRLLVEEDGFTREQVERIAKRVDEATAKRREQNRIAQRACRARQHDSQHDMVNPNKINSHVSMTKVGTLFAQESLLLTDSVSKKEKKDILRKWDFDLFWKAYPRKKAKKAAEKAFRKVEREGEVTLEGLLAAVRKIDRKTELKFIPYPATWLNAGQYLDGLAAVRSETPDEWARRKGLRTTEEINGNASMVEGGPAVPRNKSGDDVSDSSRDQGVSGLGSLFQTPRLRTMVHAGSEDASLQGHHTAVPVARMVSGNVRGKQ
jgi:hypothetical protein